MLRAVWANLDPDRLGFLTSGEFGAFMRRGEREQGLEAWKERLMEARTADMTRWRHKQSRIMHKAQHRKQRELRKRQEKIKDLRAMHQNAIDARTKSREDKLAMALRARRAPPRVCAAPSLRRRNRPRRMMCTVRYVGTILRAQRPLSRTVTVADA